MRTPVAVAVGLLLGVAAGYALGRATGTPRVEAEIVIGEIGGKKVLLSDLARSDLLSSRLNQNEANAIETLREIASRQTTPPASDLDELPIKWTTTKDGLRAKSGYFYRMVLLPDGGWRAGAWPINYGNSGNRTFIIGSDLLAESRGVLANESNTWTGTTGPDLSGEALPVSDYPSARWCECVSPESD